MNKGICVAGNMIVDVLYPIEGYPRPGELTTIQDNITKSTGGAQCNVILDLARLDPKLPLTALGCIGEDEDGELILSRLRAHKNIDFSRVKCEGTTSFTAVMSDVNTSQRTFFQCRGANAHFDESCVDWDKLDCSLLHIGYILLLDALDEKDGEYGTKMARLLHHAQQRGIKTSIDVVSEAGARFKTLVPPALKYTDYCIINEVEAEATTGVKLRDGDALRYDNIPEALKAMKACGVSTWAVIHCPEGGFGLDEKGEYVRVDGLKLPKGYIKGTVGAGDAFCAGTLYGAYLGRSLREAIELGTAAAACSLSESGASDGVKPMDEAMKVYTQLKK